MTCVAVFSALAALSWYFAFNTPLELIKDIGRILVPKQEYTAFANRALDVGREIPREVVDLVMGTRVCAVIVLISWAIYKVITLLSLTTAILPVALALVAWKLPDQWLQDQEKKCLSELQREFPTMVTLVRVYSQAGDLYQALNIAREALSGELRKQMDMLAAETELYPLSRALDNLAKRCNYPPLTNFVSVVMLGIETGADVTEVLDNFATEAYSQRINEAKRKIKSQPVILSVVPALLAMGMLLLLVLPLYSDIIHKLRLSF